MSEKPTIQNTDQKSDQVRKNAEAILADQNQLDAFFTQAEKQVGTEQNSGDAEKWNLNEPVEAFDPDAIIFEAPTYTQPPDYVAEKTHEQRLAETYNYYSDKDLITLNRNTTRSVIGMRHAI